MLPPDVEPTDPAPVPPGWSIIALTMGAWAFAAALAVLLYQILDFGVDVVTASLNW